MDESRSSKIALVAALFGVGAIFLNVHLRSSPRGAPWCSAAFSVLLLLLLGARMLARETVDRIRSALALATTSIPLAGLAVFDATRPIVDAWRYDPLELNGSPLPIIALATPVIVAFVTWLGFFAVRTRLTQIMRHATWVRGASWMVIAGAVLSLAFAGARAGRPTPGAYLASLPIIVRFAADCQASGVTIGTLHIDRGAGKGPCWPDAPPRTDDCRVAFGLGAPPPAPAQTSLGSGFQWCGPLVVRADAQRQIWILEDVSGQRLAYDAKHLDRPTALYGSRLAGAVCFPEGAVYVAAFGALVALVVLLVRRRPLVPAERSVLHDAIVKPDGMLHFVDGSGPIALPAGTRSREGAVVVELTEPSMSFRDGAAPIVRRIMTGTCAEHRFVDACGRHSLALAVLMISGAPLAAAILVWW